MRKILVLLAAVLVLALICSVGLAEDVEVFTSGDYQYVMLEDGTVQITEYSGNDAELTIPGVLDGYVVSSIGDEACYWCTGLTSVNIPSSVTSIGDSAFYWCTSLTSVSIPDSVTTLGTNPFRYCEKLERISVSPDHPALAVIDGVLFSKADKRLVCYPSMKDDTSYEILNGIRIIDDGAFGACNRLTKVSIPDSVTSIGKGAFSDCTSLTSVSIPDSVITLGANPFSGCAYLETIFVSPEHPALAVIDGVLFSKADKRLICYPKTKYDTSYEIPNGIKFIGDEAFSWCFKLTSVSIPDSVTSIGDLAFYKCYGLTSVSIPDSVTSIGDFAFYWCTSLTSVSIPNSVISIGFYAFNNCPNLTITVERNSYAAQYCKDKNIPYTYSDALDWLNN